MIVPPLTMASTSLAVLHQGAVPVFADVHPETFTIDPESIRQRLTPRTKAIIPVAIYGVPPEMDAIMEIAAENNLAVIEDAAQCFLGRYDGKTIGTIGHFGSFSFQASKHMTCGEGGMIVTDDADAATEVARFASLGYGLVGAGPGSSKIDRKQIAHPSFKRHVSLGFNYRLSETVRRLRAGAVGASRRVRGLATAVRRGVRSSGRRMRLADAATRTRGGRIGRMGVCASSGSRERQRHLGRLFRPLRPVRRRALLRRLGPSPTRNRCSRRWTRNASAPGLCPVAESIQPNLVQLKTNYGDEETIAGQAEALARDD